MNEKELLEAGYRKYYGTHIDVFFKKELCAHSKNCVNGNPDVFNVKRRPWVLPDADEAEEVKRVVETCPSGALQYIFTESVENNH